MRPIHPRPVDHPMATDRPQSTFQRVSCAAVAVALGLTAALPARADTPFSALAGSWSGGGQIRLEDGKSERLSCRAIYNPKESGVTLGMSLRCASTSYKIELRSSLRYDGGQVSGSWEERTFNAGGAVSGKATNGTIQLSFSGNISGSMSVSYGGASQRVSLTTSGSGLSGLSLNLSKG